MIYDSLIIDLRDNPGGEQESLEKIASLFLDSSKVICIDHYKDKDVVVQSTGVKTANYPIIVLVNADTASCSEILTLALKEGCNAIVVGTTTYGKGVGQSLKKTENYYYKVTSLNWTSPSGISIDKVGIKPDIDLSNYSEKDGLNVALKILS